MRVFQIHVGDTPCNLTPDDLRMLAEKTDGYSGADIAILVRDALMQPIRKVQTATHFKLVDAPKRDNPSEMSPHWTPWSPGDEGAQEKSWMDIESDELLEPEVAANDFVRAIQTTRPTVNFEDLRRHQEFTEQFGQEG